MAKSLKLNEEQVSNLIEQINGLQYGSVLVTIHDGKIVQIDRTERKRYSDKSSKTNESK